MGWTSSTLKSFDLQKQTTEKVFPTQRSDKRRAPGPHGELAELSKGIATQPLPRRKHMAGQRR